MNRSNKRPGLNLEPLEGRLAPSGGVASLSSGHHDAAEVHHRRAVEDRPQHHANEDHHVANHKDGADHDGEKKGGHDDAPGHH